MEDKGRDFSMGFLYKGDLRVDHGVKEVGFVLGKNLKNGCPVNCALRLPASRLTVKTAPGANWYSPTYMGHHQTGRETAGKGQTVVLAVAANPVNE